MKKISKFWKLSYEDNFQTVMIREHTLNCLESASFFKFLVCLNDFCKSLISTAFSSPC